MNSKNKSKFLLENKRATFDYKILEKINCGMVLKGWEVKSLRNRMANFKGSWVKINDNGVFLEGLKISPWKNAPIEAASETYYQLLLKKNEINRLSRKIKEKKCTLVPLAIFAGKKYLKCVIGIGEGRKRYDKKQLLKDRDQQREVERKIGRF